MIFRVVVWFPRADRRRFPWHEVPPEGTFREPAFMTIENVAPRISARHAPAVDFAGLLGG
ncbi:hypothetical protein SAMN06264365_11674 [Actinoplanes regularis]|uniref:Uncharacterized protein n=1 Tax=Actinoplanes regularis TaxID=52697 RepID=A0A239ERG5_9ACTN|nr:hypothetical protein SAMN06264365_11674 [Actinoplanes regularis]